MRTLRRSTLFSALTLAAVGAWAQPAPQPAAPLAPPPPLEAPSAPSAVTGRIQQWLVNPNGEVDGLMLADGTQVGFPPHLSTTMLQNFKPGDTVQVTGWRTPNLPVVRAASVGAGNRRVDIQPPATGLPPPPPRDPAALTAMSASGKVARLLYTDRGDANGVLLDNGSIVRFAPHLGAGLVPGLQVGSSVWARGWGSRTPQGSALEATAIGSSAETMRELFAGPGREPPAPGSPRGPGRAHPPRPMPAGATAPVPPVPPVPPAPPVPAS
ncbi:hypothetical protein [Rhodoferax koreensis]|uniref:hypothetical protein n=1 Tax=Rhodoferax koreensis TaxID=1842727 RepID=UPI0019514828|nr:hypothetical protein [Rhodoferax koreense]